MFQKIAELQRDIYLAFAERIGDFAASGDWTQLAIFLPVGIVFGALHALTPGHSKLVLATYLAGSGLAARRALAVSLLLSATHVATAVVIAGLALPLVSATLGSVGRAPLLEDISRGLLGVIGLWMLWQAIRLGRGRAQGHRQGAAFGLASGLVPCPLTLFVMAFAIGRSVPEAGVAFALVMLVGVAVTLAAVALAAVYARGAVLRLLEERPQAFARATAALQAGAGLLLLAVAVNEVARA
jgi:nickel/cobalt transporter (NicO) family protein